MKTVRNEPVMLEMPAPTRCVRLAGQTVDYVLRRVRRRSIGLTIGPQGLRVAAPHRTSLGEIEAALEAKSAWIVRKLAEQREYFERLQAARIDWRDGATLPFLGGTLRVVLDAAVKGAVLDGQGTGTVPGVAASGRVPAAGVASTATAEASAFPLRALRLGLPASAAPAQIRDAVHRWLLAEARRLFAERAAHFAARLGVRVARLSLTSARTRWGSASADGSVRLNWRLVHFELPTIDYVVAHELAHLRHMNHGPAFWAVVASVIPDVARQRCLLRRAAPALEGFGQGPPGS